MCGDCRSAGAGKVVFNGHDPYCSDLWSGAGGRAAGGVATAKALAFSSGKPLIGVHHIEGHVCANFLVKQDLQFPLVCLMVSGGHTNIIKIADMWQYLLLGQTRDDAGRRSIR